MIFSFFKKKPAIRYDEGLARLTITREDKFTFVYGQLDNHKKDIFSIWVPKLREAREHPDLPLEEGMNLRVTLLERDKKKNELVLFSFPSVVVAIDDVTNTVSLKKPNPNDVEAMNLGTVEEVKRYQLEARLRIRYRAEASHHEQKGETYKIRFDGISMLTNVQIPYATILNVTVELPFEQMEDKFQAKVIRSEPLPYEKKKFETVLEYLEDGVSEDLKKSIFQFALLHADISEPEKL